MKYADNDERSSRLKNIGLAVAGITAGAFALKDSGNMKYLSKAIGDLGTTISKVSDDLSTKAFKDLDYEAMSGIIKKNVLNDDSTWNMARRETGIELDYSRGLLSSALHYNKIKTDGTYLADEMFDAVQKNHVMTSLTDNIQLNENARSKSGEFFSELTKMVDESLNKKSNYLQESAKGTTLIRSEFEDRINGSILEDHKDDIMNVMESALNDSEVLRDNFNAEYRDKFKDQLLDTYKDELINKYSNKKDTFFKNTLDRAATVGDLLSGVDNNTINIKNSELFEGSHDNIVDTLHALVQHDNKFNDMVIDNATLRVNKAGELYSTKAINDLSYKAKEEFADTIPGKLFSARSFIDNKKAPDFFYLPQGSFDSILGDLTGSKSGMLGFDHFKIGNKIFQYNAGDLVHVKEADNLYLMSGRHGSFNVMNNRIQGNFDTKVQNNKTLKWLDFNTTGTNEIEKFRGFFSKFSEGSSWVGNVPKRLFSHDTYAHVDEESAMKFGKDVNQINRLYNHRTFAPSKNTITELQKVLGPHAGMVLSSLNHDNIAGHLIENEYDNFMNHDLKSLVNKYKKNISSINTIAQIGNLGDKNGMNILKYNDLLKREVVKEALLRDSVQHNSYMGNFVQGYSISHGKINKMNVTGADKKNLKNIFNWGILQQETESFSSAQHKVQDRNKKTAIMERFGKIIKGRSENAQTDLFLSEFRTGINSFIKNNSTWWKDVVIEEDNSIQKGHRNNQWVTMRKSVSALDVIKSLNDSTKAAAVAKGFGKQFYAGRNNVKDLTTMTFLPYHMLNRLITPMEKFGLGASKAHSGSVLDQVKFLGLKRILPIVGIGYAASYLNFEAENLTGTSFVQDYYNFRANFGVGVKTVAQITGMNDNHRRSRMYNPITNYWLGDYKDKDEYLDYLDNGSDPVRKGRWWSFGSASEFRGGKVSYYEPNKIRQAYSHYKDVSLYGSENEKWKHSLIPTLRHPLSPLRYLANPYWLEEKHYWDRPYPVTGSLFEEETPWGAVLNPTIGQLIKPIRRMHQSELSGTLLDVRSIIANRNNDIKARAPGNRVVRVDPAGFTPMEYNAKSMPSMGESVYSLKFNSRGKVTSAGFDGERYPETLGGVDQTVVPVVRGGGSGTEVQYVNINQEPGSVISDMLTSGLSRLVTSGLTTGSTAMSLIGGVNQGIKTRANNANEFQNNGIINENTKLQNIPFTMAAANDKNKYLSDIHVNEIGSKSDYVSSIMYSTKQLSGMYGFLADSILPASHGYQLEKAGQMNSFIRGFWDEGIGGMGGDFMEIARRFFPHENHDIDQVNPLRNTMPLWLPERYQTGDPYTKVTKGEARLPGAGYETLNKLHSDSYGRYGAFDRYKILADVSPGSDEYKTWKKITKETSLTPQMKTEMAQIEKRVKVQSSDHKFYNYQFAGKKMETRHAVINTVANAGGFTVVGSKEQYTLAGVKPLNDANKKSYIHEYLKPGMIVDLQYEDNKFRQKDNTGSISALVNVGSESISKKMWEEKKAKEKYSQDTLADKLFAASDSNKMMGPVFERIAHAQIPYLHNKYLRIDDPMESYKKEQVYGTNYSTWGHPIKGFIMPTLQTGWSKGLGVQALGLASWYWSNKARDKGLEGAAKWASHALFAFTNPYALTGGILGAIPRMNWGSKASAWNSKNGANISATIGLIGYGFAHLNNPLASAANFGMAGFAVARQLKVPVNKFPGLAKTFKIAEKEGEIIGGGKGALIGAVVGVGLSAIKNPGFNYHDMFGKYIPKNTKKKWELEEYFDRLEYMKYMGLYNKAARLSKRKDGVNIAAIVNKFEYNQQKNQKAILRLQKQKERVDKYTIDSKVRTQLDYNISNAIYKLQTPEQYYKMGKYTKAALAYKKAADTTIYGLTNNSSAADVLRALPKYDRDYFLEFAKEKDPRARKKILKMVSPYKQKALKVLWGEKVEKVKSNKAFFSNHNLPNMFWAGWRPDENLDNVKMKTIENEGMLLSDFGMYDSNKNEPAYQHAPEIKNIHNGPSPLALQRDMLGLLNGVGLHSVDVSVEPTSASGLQIVTNIGRITQYNLKQKVQNTLYNLF